MTTARDYLFGYDIADDRRRRRALNILRSECFGYQDSVFELNLNKGHAEQLVERLLPYIDPETDKLFYVRLSVQEQAWQLGTGIMTPTGQLLVLC
jgi:CRISPR-associated endonuclease Cas2